MAKEKCEECGFAWSAHIHTVPAMPGFHPFKRKLLASEQKVTPAERMQELVDKPTRNGSRALATTPARTVEVEEVREAIIVNDLGRWHFRKVT